MPAIEPAALATGHVSHLFLTMADVDRMLAFYRDVLGFEVVYAEQGVCAFVRLAGSPTFQLAFYPGEAPADRNRDWFLVVDVPDIVQAVTSLRTAGVEVGDIEDVPFGRAAKLRDPEGNVVEVHQST